MKNFFKLLIITLALSTGSLMAADHYIDGPTVNKYTVMFCDKLEDIRKHTKSDFIRNQVTDNIRNECGFRFVKPLKWYVTNGKYIPRIYGNIFSTNAMKRRYKHLIQPVK